MSPSRRLGASFVVMWARKWEMPVDIRPPIPACALGQICLVSVNYLAAQGASGCQHFCWLSTEPGKGSFLVGMSWRRNNIIGNLHPNELGVSSRIIASKCVCAISTGWWRRPGIIRGVAFLLPMGLYSLGRLRYHRRQRLFKGWPQDEEPSPPVDRWTQPASSWRKSDFETGA